MGVLSPHAAAAPDVHVIRSLSAESAIRRSHSQCSRISINFEGRNRHLFLQNTPFQYGH